MAVEPDVVSQLGRLVAVLDARAREHNRLLPYMKRLTGAIDGAAITTPIPEAVIAAKLTNAYRQLMGMAQMPWGKLVVASKLDRLEVNGITSPDEDVSRRVWEDVWQENKMDLSSKLAHRAALRDGRSHALIWPSDGMPRITLDDAATVAVEFVEGSQHLRTGAIRRWLDDDDQELVTLYRREGLYKFRRPKEQTQSGERFKANEVWWERREVKGEPWPLPNPYDVVPVVELAVNRDLAAGRFTVCEGEFANETGLIDRINLLTFLGLAVAVSMSFPLRVLIGERILRDDEGNELPPFKAYVGGVAQFEDPDAKIDQFPAADRGQLSIYDELAQLASATSTPRHYFPISGGVANVSAETIRAFEGTLHAAVNGSHKPSLGEGWEEVMRLGGRMLPSPVDLSQRAATSWADHESRSLAERADAFSKLTAGDSGFPWAAAAELALGLGTDAIQRYESEQASSALTKLLVAAQAPQTGPQVPVVAANGASGG